MLVVVQQANEQRIVDVDVFDTAATFGELANVIGIDADAAWFVDGCLVSVHDNVDGLVFNGSVISDAATAGDGGFGLRLDQVAGTDVGWSRALRAGPNVLGRSPDVELRVGDRSTSGRHCRLTQTASNSVEVIDLGSRNGTRVNGQRVQSATLHVGDVLWAGSGVYRLACASDEKEFLGATRLGDLTDRLSFNRPPRRIDVAHNQPIDIPAPPAPTSNSPTALSIAAVLSPLIMAGAIVMILGNARYALFALLGPLMAVIAWVEARHRSRVEASRHEEDKVSRLAAFDAEMADRARVERLDRWTRQPDLSQMMRWMHGPQARLWERRSSDADFAEVTVGVGDQLWRPDCETTAPAGDLVEMLNRVLHDVPVEVSLASGEVVGIVGPPEIARSVARAITLAMCATSGPSDLRVVVAAERPQLEQWGWCAWLPHARDQGDLGRPWVLADDESVDALTMLIGCHDKLGSSGSTRRHGNQLGLLVVDGESLTSGRHNGARRLWRDVRQPWSGLVVASGVDQLPSVCTVVVEVSDESGRARVHWPRRNRLLDNVQTAGVTIDRAVVAARSIARLDDPDLADASDGLPESVALADLDTVDVRLGDVAKSWETGSHSKSRSLHAVLGAGVEGVFGVDLVADGPHALVAGTTGAGKSEFLRTWIVSLALAHSPAELNIVLIDYKGGSAFDEVSALPHVVGLVTDLDEQLGGRALVCLEAELKWREQVLRDHEVGDIGDLTCGLLPRLVVVIDEFATLAAEVPQFLSALVDIAQRGRSLGVHLILATQRPGGAISNNIRANTNLRVALRVQDVADSVDVIGSEAAAQLPRSRPGRACVMLGHGEVSTIQTAHVTGARVDLLRDRVEIRTRRSPGSGPTTVSVAIAECRGAFAALGLPEPRKPWPEPLAASVDHRAVTALIGQSGAERNAIAVGVGDEPSMQRHIAHGWNLDGGNLMIAGVHGSGVEQALAAIATVAMNHAAPGDLHVHAVELLGSSLHDLIGRPHVGAVVGINQQEKLIQLVHRHRNELEVRIRSRAGGASTGDSADGGSPEGVQPRMLLLIDHLGGLIQDNQSPSGLQLIDDLRRVFTDGPAVGIHTVVAADRVGAVPSAWQAAAGQKWLFGLADPVEFQMLGLGRRQFQPSATGRGITAEGIEFQIATVPEITCECDLATGGPVPLRNFSDGVGSDELSRASLGERPWSIPVGFDTVTGAQAQLTVNEGDRVLIAGPPRSGCSNALAVIAWQVKSKINVAALASRKSCLHDLMQESEIFDDVEGLIAHLSGLNSAVAVFVDDSEEFDDPRLAELIGDVQLVVVAGGAERLRNSFGHWTRAGARSQTGLLLRPDRDLDGDLFGIRLPRSGLTTSAAGRGVLVVDARVTEVQLAELHFD